MIVAEVFRRFAALLGVCVGAVAAVVAAVVVVNADGQSRRGGGTLHGIDTRSNTVQRGEFGERRVGVQTVAVSVVDADQLGQRESMKKLAKCQRLFHGGEQEDMRKVMGMIAMLAAEKKLHSIFTTSKQSLLVCGRNDTQDF